MAEQLTIEEFAQQVKAKYPVYAKISDAELTGKILAKYPQYRSKIMPAGRKAASASEFEKNRPAFEKGGEPGLKQVLDAPLDVAIGVEKTFGIDPMHPIASSPAAAKGLLSGAANLLAHPYDTVTGLVKSAEAGVQRGGQALREGNLPAAMQSVGEVYGIAKPAAETAASLTPDLAALRKTAEKLNLPETLEQRAATNRAPVPPADLPTWGKRAAVYAAGQAVGAPHIAEGLIGLDFARRWQPYRNAKAATQEFLARKLQSPTATPPPVRETTITAKPEVPFTMPKEGPPPVRETTATPTVEHEMTQTVEAAPAQPNWKSIEDAIAPSGNIAKRAVQTFDETGKPTAFGRKLVEQVPEIAKATKATAPPILMEGMRRVLQNLHEVEDQVPEGTTVDTIPITSKLFEMSQEYAESGLQKVADQIDKIRTQWQGDNVPWGEFLAKKRAFFKDHNLRSAPMRRVYGVLMEASDRISPELAEANSNYSTVRRALDNANVDINTGRRISEVGKAPGKSSSVPIGERAAPKSDIKKTPVTNRQEGLDLFKQ